MEKLNRAQKCSNLGPQNLGSEGPGLPGPSGSAPDSLMRVFPQYKNANISNFVLAVPLKSSKKTNEVCNLEM